MSSNTTQELRIEAWPVEDLVFAENNNKKHTEETTAKLARSLADLGQIQPVIIDNKGEIIAGHGRTLAAIKLGWEKIKVIQLKVDRVTAIKMRLADNLMSNQNYDQSAVNAEIGAIVKIDGLVDDEIGQMVEGLSANDAINKLTIGGFASGDIDTDALTSDLSGDIDRMNEENQEIMTAAKEGQVPIKRALGFSTITPEQVITLKDFIAVIMAEQETEDPAEALLGFAEEYIG